MRSDSHPSSFIPCDFIMHLCRRGPRGRPQSRPRMGPGAQGLPVVTDVCAWGPLSVHPGLPTEGPIAPALHSQLCLQPVGLSALWASLVGEGALTCGECVLLPLAVCKVMRSQTHLILCKSQRNVTFHLNCASQTGWGEALLKKFP